ncbi:2-succinyl-5-enolpyruvyl-6-hydroxy-3-cyclohexene-1-carboxylic-acid synthase [Mycobacterium sp. SP-6446]|uniref:2-succinyl-5-enolpyruvyl-6-hydroxy-3- cyclohexene-1-carboxylic-acid synthase n=1 Tax=Mycobacterium sp. SP-6446 TaxID=1834162 RepID=UPI00096CEB35|nr:2-succinyl-5-enolpyruvyl-6-hydroxy-3-cyclohexene-1-carboxylic-acid synthase [Mycobacterium sp. SP-6446]
MVLADEFARCGIRDIVIAPGARSGPLVQALHQRAMLSGQRLHMHFDERAASFLALGMAKTSRRPVIVVCTSGTATANLHPAVMEASHSHLPVIVVTADRPPEMRGTGASQTTDQVKLYGSAVRLFAEVGPISPEENAAPSPNNYWRSLVCRIVASAAQGPVHLNVALREPLTFDLADDPLSRFPGRPDGKPWVAITPPPRCAAAPIITEIPARSKGLVIVGDDVDDGDAAVAFAEAAGWPLLAEPQSNARSGPNAITTYPYLLGHATMRQRLMPEIIVSVGRPGISREILGLVHEVVEHIVVDSHTDWADPTRSAHKVVPTLPLPVGPSADASWLRQWRAADQLARRALDDFLDESDLSEPRLIRDVLNHIPQNALCFIGSSMPIRDAEITMPAGRALRIICNRGLAGIDGNTSTAIGAALAHQATGGGKAYAIMGDLTFLHDTTGLISCAHSARPDLTLIVINNQGGGIFSLVGYTADAIGFEDLFASPHSVDLAGLAAATGWEHQTASTPSQLIAGINGHGPRILEVHTARGVNAKLHQRLKQHIHQHLDDGPGIGEGTLLDFLADEGERQCLLES